jgi:hypothetical protein
LQEKWLGRDGIKQEILIDLDQSFSSIVEKDWYFIPAAPASMKLSSRQFYLGQLSLILSTKKI